MYAHMYICIYIYMYQCVHTYTYTYLYICVYMFIYLYTYTYVYIMYKYIHLLYRHTHICIQIYSHVRTLFFMKALLEDPRSRLYTSRATGEREAFLAGETGMIAAHSTTDSEGLFLTGALPLPWNAW